MVTLWAATALGAPPGALSPDAAPAFPLDAVGTGEHCVLTWMSDEAGRHRELSLQDCREPFATVVRDAMWEWTWRTAPPAERRLGALDPTWVFVTSRTGAVEGLLVSWEVRFELPEVTTIVARPVVRLREGSDVRVPDGCGLLLHVDEKGRASRVQALRCDEWDRRAVEVELMSWSFEPLVVDGKPRAFAVSVYSSSGGASPNSPSGWARK